MGLTRAAAFLILFSVVASESVAEINEIEGKPADIQGGKRANFLSADGEILDPAWLNKAKTKQLGSGLVKSTLHNGDGKNFPDRGDLVTVEFTGYLHDTGSKFQNHRGMSKPYSFVLGHGLVMKGWDEGLKHMSLGERSLLHIPSELAYGPFRSGSGRVPPNSKVTYDVELLGIKKGPKQMGMGFDGQWAPAEASELVKNGNKQEETEFAAIPEQKALEKELQDGQKRLMKDGKTEMHELQNAQKMLQASPEQQQKFLARGVEKQQSQLRKAAQEGEFKQNTQADELLKSVQHEAREERLHAERTEKHENQMLNSQKSHTDKHEERELAKQAKPTEAMQKAKELKETKEMQNMAKLASKSGEEVQNMAKIASQSSQQMNLATKPDSKKGKKSQFRRAFQNLMKAAAEGSKSEDTKQVFKAVDEARSLMKKGTQKGSDSPHPHHFDHLPENMRTLKEKVMPPGLKAAAIRKEAHKRLMEQKHQSDEKTLRREAKEGKFRRPHALRKLVGSEKAQEMRSNFEKSYDTLFPKV